MPKPCLHHPKPAANVGPAINLYFSDHLGVLWMGVAKNGGFLPENPFGLASTVGWNLVQKRKRQQLDIGWNVARKFSPITFTTFRVSCGIVFSYENSRGRFSKLLFSTYESVEKGHWSRKKIFTNLKEGHLEGHLGTIPLWFSQWFQASVGEFTFLLTQIYGVRSRSIQSPPGVCLIALECHLDGILLGWRLYDQWRFLCDETRWAHVDCKFSFWSWLNI